MANTVVSSSFRVTIPREVRKQLRLYPGQKLAVFTSGGAVQLVPIPDLADLAGCAAGLDMEGYRDETDRPL